MKWLVIIELTPIANRTAGISDPWRRIPVKMAILAIESVILRNAISVATEPNHSRPITERIPKATPVNKQ